MPAFELNPWLTAPFAKVGSGYFGTPWELIGVQVVAPAMRLIVASHSCRRSTAPGSRWQSPIFESICGERVASMEMPALVTGKEGRPKESTVGPGQFVTPWLRMHWANFRPSSSAGCTTDRGQSPVIRHCVSEALPLLGSRCPHACSAAWYCEVLTPKACALPLGRLPLLFGSG